MKASDWEMAVREIKRLEERNIFCDYDEAFTINEMKEECPGICKVCYNKNCPTYKELHKKEFKYCPYCGERLG